MKKEELEKFKQSPIEHKVPVVQTKEPMQAEEDTKSSPEKKNEIPIKNLEYCQTGISVHSYASYLDPNPNYRNEMEDGF